METLSEYLKRVDPAVDLKKAADTIRMYNEYCTQIRRHHCNVCQKPLTIEDIRSIGNMDMNYTCEEHKNHRQDYNLEITRERLGIKLNKSLFDI